MKRSGKTYDVAVVTDGLGYDEQGGEEAGEDCVEAAQDRGGDDPLLAGEADELLAAGFFAGGDEGGELDLRELHGGDGFLERAGSKEEGGRGRKVAMREGERWIDDDDALEK